MLIVGDDPSAALLDMMGGDRADAADPPGAALELLRMQFPDDLVGVCFEPEPNLTVVRLAGAVEDPDAAWALSGALHAVRRLDQPHVFGPPDAIVYAVRRDAVSAVGLRRAGGPVTAPERRFVELVARHVQ